MTKKKETEKPGMFETILGDLGKLKDLPKALEKGADFLKPISDADENEETDGQE